MRRKKVTTPPAKPVFRKMIIHFHSDDSKAESFEKVGGKVDDCTWFRYIHFEIRHPSGKSTKEGMEFCMTEDFIKRLVECKLLTVTYE